MTDPFTLPIGGSIVETGECVCEGTGRWPPWDEGAGACECCGGAGEAADRWTRVGECEWLVEAVPLQAGLFG